MGYEIIGECVKHNSLDPKHNIINRPIRVVLKYKGRNRKGKYSKAFVNKELKRVESTDVYYKPIILPYDLSIKLTKRFNVPFVVKKTGSIIGNFIFGECSELGGITILDKHSACHRGQRVPMKCKEFALCYIDPGREPHYRVTN